MFRKWSKTCSGLGQKVKSLIFLVQLFLYLHLEAKRCIYVKFYLLQYFFVRKTKNFINRSRVFINTERCALSFFIWKLDKHYFPFKSKQRSFVLGFIQFCMMICLQNYIFCVGFAQFKFSGEAWQLFIGDTKSDKYLRTRERNLQDPSHSEFRNHCGFELCNAMMALKQAKIVPCQLSSKNSCLRFEIEKI